ncbi:VG15 protein [Glutamicibacter arilaitensis]|uniref:VG15 protein n=1 Tax=Glutamicibacter TaxID=1742989 RepID=UPI003FD2280C
MSRAVLNRLPAANDDISRRVAADLRRILARIDLDNPVSARAALFELVPPLIERWGDVSATAAAEWFEGFRAANGLPGPFRSVLAPPLPIEQVNARIGFATREAGHLFAGQTSEFADFMLLIANEYSLAPGHNTVWNNSARDGAAFARVPEPGACDFCLMLASRGFVYSRGTVDQTQGADGEMTRFHGGCRCHAMPVWEETRARVEYGYDPEKLLAERQGA